MKREYAAAALLVLLALAAGWNIRQTDRLTGGILAALDSSRQAYRLGDMQEAMAAADEGLQRWLEADSYTHIFIRHSEIDSTADAFYELKQQLSSGGDGDCAAAYDKLRYHLLSIQGMEHISLGSIL